ncbi:hypothetical protein GCM10010252_29710 [Streptomyces aureoverticillatus]|nr:hypothetical protein GCM10010252_29710 [Streptomyces aureoverticillatus]
MRTRVEVPSGLLLRRWEAADAASVLTAFADPLMRGQSREPVDSVDAVEGRQRQKLAYDGVRHDVELHARLATDPEPSTASATFN